MNLMDAENMTAKNMDKKQILIVRYGEVALKGMNKPYFERILAQRVENAIRKIPRSDFNPVDSDLGVERNPNALPGNINIERSDGLMIISCPNPELPIAQEKLINKIIKVFGIASVSPAISISSKDIDDVSNVAIEVVANRLAEYKEKSRITGGENSIADAPLSFKVFGKRADKTYPITSPEMSATIGGKILDALGDEVKVNVYNPDVSLFVHLRRNDVFIFDEKIAGFGGLPLGTNGKGMVLLSGGIDSPVALWLMAKRGMSVEVVHYHSYPYTSKRAQEKVEELASILAGYCGNFKMHVVNLLPIQEEIAQHCPEEFMTIIVRRFMMRIAEQIALKEGCNMVVTGESLGQVASQTAASLFVTDASVNLPVMRPLIALDKVDIMDIAREIGTFEKSIEPYEDCCTVFLPKHPSTKPKIADVEKAEDQIPCMDELVSKMIEEKEVIQIKFRI